MIRNTSVRTINLNQMFKDAPQNNQPNQRLDYKKFIYVNKQNQKKQNQTIFHSPYKNGKKNQNYQNPTFMSSDIFYSQDYVFNNNSQNKPKLAIIPNKNDVKRQQLKLLSKSKSQIKLSQTKQKQKSPKPHIKDDVIRKIRNNQTLMRQLNTLKAQRQNISPNRSISKSISANNLQNPVYFQKNYGEHVISRSNKKKELLQYLKGTLNKKQQNKQNAKQRKRIEKKMMDAQSLRFYANIVSSLEFQRQRAKLLNQMLNEQIKTKK